MKTLSTYERIGIPVDDVLLRGRLRVAENPKGVVIFSHGSGSGRLSSRNNYVAEYLQMNGFASLLFDLLTENEDRHYENRFDIPLLSHRLVKTTQWVFKHKPLADLPIGYFGASTGAASALFAASRLKDRISALVSRGGRPDLAMSVLDSIEVPTLLIVGGDDHPVITLNHQAFEELAGIKKLEIIEGATHLFGEPGKLEKVAELATLWFNDYLK
ncbi:dienelactone hydrolase family protein [Aestuariivivens sediminicola]|uniref:dienelactone hydrolase family protein n=1 Tax=Aestuariivivens sediminicola TaxID=2913560 RepID=UPI001F56E472|nr:dienelactone hydrolase family protein [Aestuariivivens sediminicola]